MKVWIAAVAALVLVGAAWADRVPSSKAPNARQPGGKEDVRVPYTTNGYSNLGVAQGVAPKIIKDPEIDNMQFPGVIPTYNLPFWGGIQGFSDRSNGVAPRT